MANSPITPEDFDALEWRSPEDAKAYYDDLLYFGRAWSQMVGGKKIRIDPREVYEPAPTTAP